MPKTFKESTRARKPSAKAADAKAAADAAAAKKAGAAAAKQLPSTKKSKVKASRRRQSTGNNKAPKRNKTGNKTNSKEPAAVVGTADADGLEPMDVSRATRSQKKKKAEAARKSDAADSPMAPSDEGDEDTLKLVHDKRGNKKPSKKGVSSLAASSTSLEASLSTNDDVKKSSSNVKTEVKNERKDGRVREGDVHSMFDSVSSRKSLSILEQPIEEDNKTNMFDWLKIIQTESQRTYINVTRTSKFVPECK